MSIRRFPGMAVDDSGLEESAPGICTFPKSVDDSPAQKNDADPFIPAAEIRVLLQFGVSLQQLPGQIVRNLPVLAENIAGDLPLSGQFKEAFLDRDTNVASDPVRAVTVNDLQHAGTFLASPAQFAFQALKGLRHRRHVSFQIADFDG